MSSEVPGALSTVLEKPSLAANKRPPRWGDFAGGEAPEVTYHRCLDNQIDTELRGIQEAD